MYPMTCETKKKLSENFLVSVIAHMEWVTEV